MPSAATAAAAERAAAATMLASAGIAQKDGLYFHNYDGRFYMCPKDYVLPRKIVLENAWNHWWLGDGKKKISPFQKFFNKKKKRPTFVVHPKPADTTNKAKMKLHKESRLSMKRLSTWKSVFEGYEKEIVNDAVYVPIKDKPTSAQVKKMFDAAHKKVEVKVKAAQVSQEAQRRAAGGKARKSRKRPSESRSPTTQYDLMAKAGFFPKRKKARTE